MSDLLTRRALLRRPQTSHTATPPAMPPALKAVVGGGCLAAAGVTCGSCADPCEPVALRLRPLGRGRALPVIDMARCTGCGDCLMVCPVSALSLQPFPPEDVPCA